MFFIGAPCKLGNMPCDIFARDHNFISLRLFTSCFAVFFAERLAGVVLCFERAYLG